MKTAESHNAGMTGHIDSSPRLPLWGEIEAKAHIRQLEGVVEDLKRQLRETEALVKSATGLHDWMMTVDGTRSIKDIPDRVYVPFADALAATKATP